MIFPYSFLKTDVCNTFVTLKLQMKYMLFNVKPLSLQINCPYHRGLITN